MTEIGADLQDRGRVDRGRRLALGVILLVGTALRLFRLGAESLWYDETVSTYLAGSPVAELLRHTAGDIHPPGYYLLLRGWLLLTGYPAGRAGLQGNGLEFAAGFFSLFFGVVLIVLVYALARRLAGARAGLAAAALVALSPFNVWYSQEVRMYTLGAVLGVVTVWALLDIARGPVRPRICLVYALAAAAGMYTLYYFAFLLIPLNVWALIRSLQQRRSIRPLLLSNGAAVVFYAPWIGVAFRQATQPPVPPWRTPPNLPLALLESWTALSFGQSAPAWAWPGLLLTLGLFVVGLVSLSRVRRRERLPADAVGLAVATLGPLFLILVISLLTPLYHVRYLFTYSPAFYVVLAAGLIALWRRARAAGVLAALVLLLGAGVTLAAFWFNPAFRADDHRAAVHELQARWRPGDVVVINAGWAYTALATYWDGEIAGRYRITGALPEPRGDAALVMITTGHTDGDPGLGWGDSRSDFFAMPGQAAKQQVADLFSRFPRVWHYRIYDTVNDADGLIRALLPRHGQVVDERTYAGEAYLRVEAYAPRAGAAWDEAGPGATFGDLQVRFTAPARTLAAGDTLYPAVTWLPASQVTTRVATSLRLVGLDGEVWAQPPDEQPLGPLFASTQWPQGVPQWQPLGLPVPLGTPPGQYRVVLVVYDAATGQPLDGAALNGAIPAEPGLLLGTVAVTRPAQAPPMQPALAVFGALALVEADTPVTSAPPGSPVPVNLLWQARGVPAEPLVVVVQALDENGAVAAGLEEQPVRGRYPTQLWAPGELVRDQHTLELPATLRPGRYRVIAGVYRAADRNRLTTRQGLLTNALSWTIKEIDVN